MGKQATAGDGTFKCAFGHAPSQLGTCWRFEILPLDHLEHVSEFGHFNYAGYFRPDTRAHVLMNKSIPAERFRSYFNQRDSLTSDERKALAMSPRLTKAQKKKLLMDYYYRTLLLNDVRNFLSHDLIAESVTAWDERILSSFSATKGLKAERYRELFAYEPKNVTYRIEVKDDDGLRSYPSHWDSLALNESVPADLLLQMLQKEPTMAAEMMQRVETLPVELYFQVPRNNFERTRCLNLLEAREYEVRAWLEKECPELAEVPLDWVFEVLSPREW